MRGKRAIVGATIIVTIILAIILAPILQRTAASDEERIVRLVAQAQTAVERRNSTGLTRLISRDYADRSGVTRQQLVAYIVQWMRSGEEVTVVPSITSLRINDSFADLLLNVRLWRGPEPTGRSHDYMMTVRLQKEDGQWKAISADGWAQAQSDFMGEE